MSRAGQVVLKLESATGIAQPVTRRAARARARACALLSVILTLSPYLGPADALVAQTPTGRITGVVTEARTGRPLPNAQVDLEPDRRATLTTSNGRYFLRDVRPGTYRLTVERIGYRTYCRENVRITIGETLQIDVELEPRQIAVSEIRGRNKGPEPSPGATPSADSSPSSDAASSRPPPACRR